VDARDSIPARADSADPFGLVQGGEGIITGTVVCAAVIAAGAGYASSTAQLVGAMVGTVFVYWLAHMHAEAIGGAVSEGHHPFVAVRRALAHTWTIAAASLLPVVVLLVAELAGADLKDAAWIALWATVALLAFYSFVAGRRGGLGIPGSMACALAGVALGLLVTLLKVALK
jgi:hypothetical protein